jgi:hypothetical protein
VPVVLAVAGFLIATQQDARQRELEEQRAEAAALQAYLDQMGQLLLEEDLRTSEAGSDTRLLARARTLTVLARLSARPSEGDSNKEQAVEFLSEAELVQDLDGKGPVISLEESELGGIDLDDEDLRGANLTSARLEGADLTDAVLTDAVLTGVKGVTNEELESQARSLEGATMPDGSKHP